MIDGNLAVEAHEPVACAWATCQWGGCTRGRFRLVSVPGVGKLWLYRLHLDERRRWGRPAVKVREHDEARACQWPGGCNGSARVTMPILGVGRLRLCRNHAQAVADERSAEARAGRSQRTATPQAAPSPAVKVRKHDEARTCRLADGRPGARAAAFAWLASSGCAGAMPAPCRRGTGGALGDPGGRTGGGAGGAEGHAPAFRRGDQGINHGASRAFAGGRSSACEAWAFAVEGANEGGRRRGSTTPRGAAGAVVADGVGGVDAGPGGGGGGGGGERGGGGVVRDGGAGGVGMEAVGGGGGAGSLTSSPARRPGGSLARPWRSAPCGP